MHPDLAHVVQAVIDRRDLSADELHRAIAAMMEGGCHEADIASVLTALRIQGETAAQLVGAARALRERCLPIPTRRAGLLDTCGTGGDGLHTFNISTATALVAAAAGVPVAKHGNRSATSRSGSADVLEALGIPLDLTPAQVGRCLDELGIGFCFAPTVHTAMKHVAPVRRQLGFRTLFNLLGPLTNPARAEYQLVGAGRLALAALLAEALQELGVKQALVVCGNDELDEVALWGQTTVWRVRGHTRSCEQWTAQELGLPGCRPEELRVSSPQESAQVIRAVLSGQPGAARDMVLANTAAALVAAERVASPTEGVRLAADTIDSGRASAMLDRFVKFCQELKGSAGA